MFRLKYALHEKDLPSFWKDITIGVMDSHLYTEVIDRILSQAICPRCGASIQESAYDILSVDMNRIILELDCEHCESVLTVNGVFQRKRAISRRQNKPVAIVSPETVRGVGQVLREFQGESVRDLLRK